MKEQAYSEPHCLRTFAAIQQPDVHLLNNIQ